MTLKNYPIVRFPYKGTKLTSSEKKVVAKLVKAAEAIALIYLKQENRNNNGANFYPRDTIKKLIQDAAKEDPEILSPYTMVEKDSKGKLKAIPFHIKFKSQLKKVAKYIREAAKITDYNDLRLELGVREIVNGSSTYVDLSWAHLQVPSP